MVFHSLSKPLHLCIIYLLTTSHIYTQTHSIFVNSSLCYRRTFIHCIIDVGRTQRSNIQGSLHLKMWLSTRENRGLSEEEGMWNEIWQHQQIYTIFLCHMLNKKSDSVMIIFRSSYRIQMSSSNYKSILKRSYCSV